MAVIALDATYAMDPEPSGIAMYSRRLIEELAALETPHRFLLCYRVSRFGQRREFLCPRTPGEARFGTRFYQEPFTFWLPWQAELFHSLAQRPPGFRFRREIVTVFDAFPLTGTDYSTADFRRKFSTLLREAVARAALVLTASHCVREQLIDLLRAEAGKIRVIPLGVDLPGKRLSQAERDAERRRWAGDGGKILFTAGAIQTRKNTLNMLRALERLPAEFQLLLAGGKGYGHEAVFDYIHERRLEQRVRALGYVSAAELAKLYEAANVFLFPSLEEGFGLPVLEAMAHGTPVVTSSASSLPETGGDAALYAEPNDPDDIAEKIRQAAEDSDLRTRLVERGFARARQFTWRRTAEATLAAYDEALKMHP